MSPPNISANWLAAGSGKPAASVAANSVLTISPVRMNKRRSSCAGSELVLNWDPFFSITT